MAKVNTRKRGKYWEYYFEAAKVEGKRSKISKGGYPTQKEAFIEGTKALEKYNSSGLNFVPSEISFNDYKEKVSTKILNTRDMSYNQKKKYLLSNEDKFLKK